ncbi:MAG TPA: TolC family protein [Oculatellaceae cyanobacterium]
MSVNRTAKCKIASGSMMRPETPSSPNIRPLTPAHGSKQSKPLTPQVFPDVTPLPQDSKPFNKAKEQSAQPSSATSGTPVAAAVEYFEDVPDMSAAPPLRVVDALNEALINGPRAAAIRAQFGITQAGYAAATMVQNPIFLFDRGAAAEFENRIGPILTEQSPWKLFFRFLVQKRLVDQKRFDLMSQLWQFRSEVRRTYIEVVVSQETFKTVNELYELAAKLEAVTNKRLIAGTVAELDLLKSRLATHQANVDRVVAAQRVIRARQQLNLIMGRPVDGAINVPPLPDYTGVNVGKGKTQIENTEVLPDFSSAVEPLPSFLSIAENNRLELKSLQQQLKVNQAQLKAAYGNVVPDQVVGFGKSSGPIGPPGPILTAVFFTVYAPIPITNTNQGNIAQYKATLKQLRFQINTQRNQINSEVSSAYQNLAAAREKLQIYRDSILANSLTVARLARRSYEVGQSDITAALTAQQANVQTQTEYLDAVMSYQSSFTDLEQASGIPLQ